MTMPWLIIRSWQMHFWPPYEIFPVLYIVRPLCELFIPTLGRERIVSYQAISSSPGLRDL